MFKLPLRVTKHIWFSDCENHFFIATSFSFNTFISSRAWGPISANINLINFVFGLNN